MSTLRSGLVSRRTERRLRDTLHAARPQRQHLASHGAHPAAIASHGQTVLNHWYCLLYSTTPTTAAVTSTPRPKMAQLCQGQ